MTFSFIVDINPEMNTLVISNPSNPKFSALDIAKSAIESFLSSTITVSNMPLILSVNGENRNAVLSPLGSPISKFENRLKNLTTQNDSKDFAYILSLTFSLYNKYRLKNGIDKYGYGLFPYLIDPFNTVIITNRTGLLCNQTISSTSSQLKISKEAQSRSNLSEFHTEFYRWDQHIYLIVISDDTDIETSQLIQSGEFASLVKSSGGDVFRCSNMKTAQLICRDLALKIFFNHPSVTIKLNPLESIKPMPEITSISESVGSSNNNNNLPSMLVHMSIKGNGEWLIPEAYWIDLGTDTLKPRLPQPILSLSEKFLSSAGVYNTDTSPNKFLSFAKSIGLPIDTYPLIQSKVMTTIGIESQSKKVTINSFLSKKCQFTMDKLYVSVQNSGRLESNNTMQGIPTLSNTSYPFAILSQNETTYSWELLILPYNFTKLLPMLMYILDQQINNPTQNVSKLTQWKQEFTQYLWTCPQYTQSNIIQTLHRVYPQLRSILQLSIEAKLHRIPFRKILKAQESATADIIIIERLAKENWMVVSNNNISSNSTYNNKDINTLAIESSSDLLKSTNLPESVYDVKSDELLGVWERMRKVMYGSYGMTIQGLSVKGFASNCNSINVHYDNRVSILSDEEILFTSIGAKNINDKSIKEMSDYRPILAIREVLRDPENLSPDADEDTVEGLLKRKFDVNFGNRYKKSNKKSRIGKGNNNSNSNSNNNIGSENNMTDDNMGGMEIEGISGIVSSILPKGTIPNNNTISEDSIANTLAKADLFFMDTPNPYAVKNSRNDSSNDNEEEEEEEEESRDLLSETSSITSMSSDSDQSVFLELTKDHRNRITSMNSVMEENNKNDAEKYGKMDKDKDNASTTTESTLSTTTTTKEPELPPNWTQCFSSRHNRVYWFNSITGQSVWEFPTT